MGLQGVKLMLGFVVHILQYSICAIDMIAMAQQLTVKCLYAVSTFEGIKV